MGNGKSTPDSTNRPPSPTEETTAPLPNPDHVVGLENFGNTCYCNSVIQALYQCRAVRSAVLRHRRRGKDDTHTLLTRLAQLFQMMDGTRRKGVVTPTQFVQTVRKMRPEYNSAQHQDAPEFLNYILNDVMELEKRARLGGGEAPPHPTSPPPATVPQQPKTFVEDVFQGAQVTQTTCLGCDTGSDRKETFLQLQVEIFPNTSLTHCLKNYFKTEALQGTNKLKCDACGGLTEGRIRLQLADMPKVLAIQLKRFRYCESIQGLKKLPYRVVFPTSNLMSGGKEYSLRGVVVHQGSHTNVGHYFSCVRTSIGQWWLLDDDVCTKLDETDVHVYFGHSAATADESPPRRSSSSSGGNPIPTNATTAYLLLYEETVPT